MISSPTELNVSYSSVHLQNINLIILFLCIHRSVIVALPWVHQSKQHRHLEINLLQLRLRVTDDSLINYPYCIFCCSLGLMLLYSHEREG